MNSPMADLLCELEGRSFDASIVVVASLRTSSEVLGRRSLAKSEGERVR